MRDERCAANEADGSILDVARSARKCCDSAERHRDYEPKERARGNERGRPIIVMLVTHPMLLV